MYVTIISFIIAIVGIILQLADAFPEHRDERKAIVLLSLGVFIGVGVSAAFGAKYEVTGNVDRQFALLFGLAGAAALFAFMGVLVSDEKRRDAAFSAAGVASFAFMLTGAFVAFGAGISTRSAEPEITRGERLILATAAEQRKDYGAAIEHLKQAQTFASKEAGAAIKARIQRIAAAEAAVAEKGAEAPPLGPANSID